MTVMKPVINGVKKVTKAQDQYNLAVEQFGAASMQASRASAHLYGIIATQGGKPVSDAANNLRKLKKEWADATAPARGHLLGVLNQGLDATRTVMPTLSMGTNQIAASVESAMKDVFKVLQSNEMRQNFRSMFQIFDKSIGPGLRGFANVLLVIGRIIRAAGPWVIKWAKSWEETTKNWRKGTADSGKLSRFFDKAVDHFKAWWGLAKALGRVLKTIFSNSQSEGLMVVTTLTNLVDKFNEWLIAASANGKIDEFWKKYNKSVEDAVWALQNPIQAINKWLPKVMDAIATGMATHAPQAANVFIRAFLDSGGWAQLLTVAWFMKKFGIFSAIGRRSANLFIVPFVENVGAAFLLAVGGEQLTGKLGSKIRLASATMGRGAGKAMGKGMLVGLVIAAPAIIDEISIIVQKAFGVKHPQGTFDKAIHDIAGALDPRNITKHLPGRIVPGSGGASGGVIPPFGSSLVGERGPEIAFAGARGTQITPLTRNSRNNFAQPSLPDLEGMINITVHSHLHVERREIAHAVEQQKRYEKARRGGRPG
jgi:hypothetical protein